MILINEYWEAIEDPYDVMKIIEENIGREFANKMREIYGDEESVDELRNRIYELECEVDELSFNCFEYEGSSIQVDEFNENFEKLKDYIDNYNVETDYDKAYISGLKDAYMTAYYGDEL